MSDQDTPKVPFGDQTFADLGEGQFKWDRDFPTENIFTAFIGISLVALIITIIIAFQGEMPWTFPGAALAMMAAFIILRLKVDQYYIFDSFQSKLLARHKIIFVDNTVFVADYTDLLGITIQSKFQQSKYRSWWEYFPVIVFRSGKIIPLNPVMQNDPAWVESAAKDMASKARIDFFSPPGESLIEKQKEELNNWGDLTWISQKDFRNKKNLLVLFIVIGFFIIFGVFMFIAVNMF